MTLLPQLPVVIALILAGWAAIALCEPDVRVPARVRQRVARLSKRRGSR